MRSSRNLLRAALPAILIVTGTASPVEAGQRTGRLAVSVQVVDSCLAATARQRDRGPGLRRNGHTDRHRPRDGEGGCGGTVTNRNAFGSRPGCTGFGDRHLLTLWARLPQTAIGTRSAINCRYNARDLLPHPPPPARRLVRPRRVDNAASGLGRRKLSGVAGGLPCRGAPRPASARSTLDRAFEGVEPIPRVIELDGKQPESRMTSPSIARR